MQSWQRPEIPSVPGRLDARVTAHDTLRRAVVPVGPDPADGPATARLYVCGITPYDATHLGHAATYLAYDLLLRAWLDAGLDIRYAQNVTDVDEPLLERAEATGRDWRELALEQTALFREDMEALRIIPPDAYVGAVESVPLVASLVERLDERGYVYAIDDEHPDLYFRAPAAPGFGTLSGLPREEMIVKLGANGGDPERPGKQDPLDVVVWRRERADEPSWETPLGSGRPGWHIECTAISLEHLGARADVQGGGTDLVFPHHEMCAAQAMAATGEPLADAFVNGGMVGYEGHKMSKSRGNLVFVSALRRDGVDPMAIRLALLAHHCRDDWEWTGDELRPAQARLSAWRQAVARATAAPANEVVTQLRLALRDDQNAPRALAVIDEWAATPGDDPAAPASVRAAVDALLGVAL